MYNVLKNRSYHGDDSISVKDYIIFRTFSGFKFGVLELSKNWGRFQFSCALEIPYDLSTSTHSYLITEGGYQ